MDVELPDGNVMTAHTANTGAMTGCSTPGSRVWLSRSDNPKRKYPYTWEIIEISPNVLCGINTQISNNLVAEAIEAQQIPELAGYAVLRREVAYGQERSRIDILLENHPTNKKPPCYIEVKNVTLAKANVALFPDAKTARGKKHLRELMEVVKAGQRAVIFYCVQRNDCHSVSPADEVDPEYGQLLREAITVGVEALAYQAEVSINGIQLSKSIPVRI